jgi:hypothetical protein
MDLKIKDKTKSEEFPIHENFKTLTEKKNLKREREEQNYTKDSVSEKKTKSFTNISLLVTNPFEIQEIVEQILSFVRTPVTKWDSGKKFHNAISKNALCTRNINKIFRESYFKGEVKILDSSWLIKKMNDCFHIIPEMRIIPFEGVHMLITNVTFMQLVLELQRDGDSSKFSNIQFGNIGTIKIDHQYFDKTTGNLKINQKYSNSNFQISCDTICGFIEKQTNQTTKDVNIVNVKNEPREFSQCCSHLFKSCISQKSFLSGDYILQ